MKKRKPSRSISKSPLKGSAVLVTNEGSASPCADQEISSPVDGFFRLPPIWIESRPKEAPGYLIPQIHHQTALSRKLKSGITLRVQRDGLFLFDFSNGSFAPPIRIQRTSSVTGAEIHIPEAELKLQADAESHAVLRAMLMNVFQLCFAVACREANLQVPLGNLVDYSTTFKLLNVEETPQYSEDFNNSSISARNVANSLYGVDLSGYIDRPLIPASAVHHGCDLLDALVEYHKINLVPVLESIYVGAKRLQEKRFGESVVLTWTACEQMISSIWIDRVVDKAAIGSADRMTSTRKKTLTGRDYSASIMIEFLELSDLISPSLYAKLSIARKSRNNWAHSMTAPTLSQVISCQEAALELIEIIAGIKLRFQSNVKSAVPTWQAEEYDLMKRYHSQFQGRDSLSPS